MGKTNMLKYYVLHYVKKKDCSDPYQPYSQFFNHPFRDDKRLLYPTLPSAESIMQ